MADRRASGASEEGPASKPEGRASDRLVLASKSPRRRELLASIGLAPVLADVDVDETPPKDLPPREVALAITRKKLETALATRTNRAEVVLAADTVVWLPRGDMGWLMGKPRDDDEARRMIEALVAGREHEVITAFALGRPGTGLVHEEAVQTAVFFRAASPAEIAAYVATGEPRDKAGAYAIQGAGAALVDRIEGSWTNVVGLPLAEVAVALARVSDLRAFTAPAV